MYIKIAFIDPTNYVINYGLRVLAAYAAEQGHDVCLIFLPLGKIDNSYNYSAGVYSDLKLLIKDADMVGVSFVSNYLGQARYVTRYIKSNFSIPVAWGGVHATADPEGSLEYADMVCLGEGEEALISLLNKMEKGEDITDSKNFWFRRGGAIIKNEMAPLTRDLDRYPYPFYDLEREFILENDHIVPMTLDKMNSLSVASKEYFGLKNAENYYYLTLSSRGCLNNCAYCCNNLYLKLYKDKTKILRRRSVDHLIGELLKAIDKFPFINFISIFDDDFCAVNKEYIYEFSKKYKKRINLPFKCNVSPNSVSDEKIRSLAEAGLVSVEMGLQSASPRVNREIYTRKVSNERFVEAARILNRYKGIMPYYDIITDNPFESKDELLDTARFLTKLPKPYRVSTFSLTFFPGTDLYRTAKEQKIISDLENDVCDKKNNTLYLEKDPYIKFLLVGAPYVDERNFFQTILFNILSSGLMISLLNRKLFISICEIFRRLRRTYRFSKNIKLS